MVVHSVQNNVDNSVSRMQLVCAMVNVGGCTDVPVHVMPITLPTKLQVRVMQVENLMVRAPRFLSTPTCGQPCGKACTSLWTTVWMGVCTTRSCTSGAVVPVKLTGSGHMPVRRVPVRPSAVGVGPELGFHHVLGKSAAAAVREHPGARQRELRSPGGLAVERLLPEGPRVR